MPLHLSFTPWWSSVRSSSHGAGPPQLSCGRTEGPVGRVTGTLLEEPGAGKAGSCRWPSPLVPTGDWQGPEGVLLRAESRGSQGPVSSYGVAWVLRTLPTSAWAYPSTVPVAAPSPAPASHQVGKLGQPPREGQHGKQPGPPQTAQEPSVGPILPPSPQEWVRDLQHGGGYEVDPRPGSLVK